MDEKYGKGWFFVGEFWKDSLEDMNSYLDRMDQKFSLFGAPLVHNFSAISQAEGATFARCSMTRSCSFDLSAQWEVSCVQA